MTARSEYLLEPASIRNELRVLNLSVFFMIIFAALNFVSFFRLLGVPAIPPILLVSYRLMDALIILAFLIYCGSRVKVKVIDLFLLVFAFYPILIGLAHGNISLTFANDIVIFFSFFAKIIVFRTILTRISLVTNIDTIFQKNARRIVFWCGFFASISLVFATIMIGRGASFYYQAPAELTFAAALVLAQGKIFLYLIFLGLAIVGGKRMIIIGVLAMIAVAGFANPKVRSAVLRFSFVGLILFPLALVVGSTYLSGELAFVDRILATWRQLERTLDSSEGFLDFLMFMDPGRYVEFVSLQPYLTGWSLWFGNGFGFRYDLDSAFLLEFGFADDLQVTNAHFTPLAVVAKFGLFGLAIWLVLIFSVLIIRFDRRSYVHYACYLAFLSMIVQSVFAFGFFVNMFTPFYIAMLMVGGRRKILTRHPSMIDKQRQEYT